MKYYLNPRNGALLWVIYAFLWSGCTGSGQMSQIRADLEDQLESGHYKYMVGVRVGPVLSGVARWVLRLADEDEDTELARDILRDFKRAYVRVYELKGRLSKEEVRTPRPLRDLIRQGWEMGVRVKDEDSNVWMLYKESRHTIRDLYMVVMDDENLVMVRAQGNFEHIVARAIENQDR